MVKEEALIILDQLRDLLLPVDDHLDSIGELFGHSDSPFTCAIWALEDHAVKSAAELTSIHFDVLIAWWTEHRFGERPMEVKYRRYATSSATKKKRCQQAMPLSNRITTKKLKKPTRAND